MFFTAEGYTGNTEKSQRARRTAILYSLSTLCCLPVGREGGLCNVFHQVSLFLFVPLYLSHHQLSYLGGSMYQLNQLSGSIIGAAIEVHRILGPGLLESAYEECLSHELTSRGLSIDRQKPVPIIFKNIKLDCGYRIDILVERQVVLELKSVDALIPVHEAQILTYMKFSEKKLGLLINFNVKTLKEGLRRFIF